MKKILLLLWAVSCFQYSQAQIDDDQLGAWYMYFYSANLGDGPWGIQGDAQWRNWDMAGDLEQLLLRSGLTYRPNQANVLLTLGYANITTGEFGESTRTVNENRIYQELMYPTKLGNRFHLNHRFRYEQRFLAENVFRTRYRFNLFVNVPLNNLEMTTQTIYLALYNELFINGSYHGDGSAPEEFDRNRLYAGFGYFFSPSLRTQFGIMNQSTNSWSKNQLQLSLHHQF